MFNNIQKLSIKVISECNLQCVYCHQLKKDKLSSNQFTNFDNLKKFLLSIPLSDKVDITITGGEITLQPDIFLKTVKVFKNIEQLIDVEFNICITSNGTNIDLLFDWCDKKIINPQSTVISWDGLYSSSKSRMTNGKYDDEYFKDVIKKIGQSKYNNFCITHAIAPMTIQYLKDSFEFCLENNVTNIGYYYIHEASYQNQDLIKEFKNQLYLIAELMIDRMNNGQEISYYNWQIINSRLQYSNNFYTCQKLGNNYHIDVDGKIYPCIYFGDHNTYSFGHLDNGIDENTQNTFIEELSTPPKCDYKTCGLIQCSECPASCFVHKKSLSERFCNQCHLLPIELQIYNEYVPKIKNPFINLNISKDILHNNIFENKNEMRYYDETGDISPTYKKVSEW